MDPRQKVLSDNFMFFMRMNETQRKFARGEEYGRGTPPSVG